MYTRRPHTHIYESNPAASAFCLHTIHNEKFRTDVAAMVFVCPTQLILPKSTEWCVRFEPLVAQQHFCYDSMWCDFGDFFSSSFVSLVPSFTVLRFSTSAQAEWGTSEKEKNVEGNNGRNGYIKIIDIARLLFNVSNVFEWGVMVTVVDRHLSRRAAAAARMRHNEIRSPRFDLISFYFRFVFFFSIGIPYTARPGIEYCTVWNERRKPLAIRNSIYAYFFGRKFGNSGCGINGGNTWNLYL